MSPPQHSCTHTTSVIGGKQHAVICNPLFSIFSLCDIYQFLKMKLKPKKWFLNTIEEIQIELQQVFVIVGETDFQRDIMEAVELSFY